MTNNLPWQHIDWAALHHLNDSTPDAIVAALTLLHQPGTSTDACRVAIDTLLYIQDSFNFTMRFPDTVPPLLRALLPLYVNPSFAEHGLLTDRLEGVLMEIDDVRERGVLPLGMMQRLSAAVTALHEHIPHLATALDSQKAGLSEFALSILTFMYDVPEQVLPILIERYGREGDVGVKEDLLEAMSLMCCNFRLTHRTLPDYQHPGDLQAVFDQLQWLASIAMEQPDTQLQDIAIMLALRSVSGTVNDVVIQTIQRRLHETPPPLHGIDLTENPTALSTTQWSQVLDHPNFNHAQIHRYLLDYAIARDLIDFKPVFHHGDQVYRIPNTAVMLTTFNIKPHNIKQAGTDPSLAMLIRPTSALMDFFSIIVDSERFWEAPLNLVSVCTGFPDDRVLLREYLARVS